MNEDLFGSIKQTITETAGAVGKKTEEFVETQKMRNKVRTLQREIRKKYADVGEIVYKRYVDGDTMDEELTGHCEVVMGLQKELAECKESMAAKQGKNVCPACGISNPKDAVFCMYCGTELPGEEEEKEEEWFTQGPVEETEDQEEKEETEGEEPETEVHPKNINVDNYMKQIDTSSSTSIKTSANEGIEKLFDGDIIQSYVHQMDFH